jgi:hypothetical protein
MALPKYITHPILIGILIGALGFVLWVGSDAPPPPDGLWEIMGFSRGRLTLKGTAVAPFLSDGRFSGLTEEQDGEVARFFAGKFIKLVELPRAGSLSLPVEIYDSSCFEPAPNKTRLACPLVLTP